MGQVPGDLLAVSVFAALLLLMASLPSGAASNPTNMAWPDFRGGPENPGSRDVMLVPEGWEPVLNWSKVLPSGITTSVTGYGNGLYAGTLNGTLFRLDAEDGRTVWSRELGGTMDAAPLIIEDGSSVIAATSEGLVVRLEAAKGKVQWSWKNPSGGRIFSSPKESSGLIYFGSYDSSFYCLYSGNGTVKWTYPGCDGFIHTTPGLAELNGRTVVLFGACDGTMNCLDAMTGDVVWRFRTAYIPSSPSISGGNVFFGSYDRKLFCLDLNDGSEVWNTSLPDDVYSSPAVLGGRVAVGCNDGRIYLLTGNNGTVKWSREMGKGPLESSPLLFRDVVAVTTGDGLFFLDVSNGSVTRGFELGNAEDISPTCIGGSVLFGDPYGNLFAISIRETDDNDDDLDEKTRVPLWMIITISVLIIGIPIMVIIILTYIKVIRPSYCRDRPRKT
ncbi:MAG: PQQ-binding-like beta-propeller repeat protein [Candidatus Thermoplasmatota archaeon]|jgi:outer membrane protein assembly factor BamB|nr:PQQ-binding-like beta-propeller repeat protein [Candidatus Thermoplasmatota archaeon]